MNLKSTDKISVSNYCLFVNGKPFVVDFPTEPLIDVAENMLLTRYRGNLINYWQPEEIQGYYA